MPVPLHYSNSIPASRANQQFRCQEPAYSDGWHRKRLGQPPSSESFRSFTEKRSDLGSYKRNIGNVPTLYNIDTKEPLPVSRPKDAWSATSTEVSSPEIHRDSLESRNLPLWWTATLAVVPVLAFTVTFIAIVAVHRVQRDMTSPFDDIKVSKRDWVTLLVQFSPTRLVFVAGFGSTIAPLLLGSLMTLWHYPTARKLFILSSQEHPDKLPTPQQLSMLISLSAGSIDELRKYVLYRCRRFRAKEANMLTASALVLFVSALLAGLVLLADIGIHNFTSTTQISSAVESQTIGANGRGLAPHCIGFSRASNQGLPCSVVADDAIGANAMAFDPGEIILMGRNRSRANTPWTLSDHEDPNQDLLLLLPKIDDLDSDQDFQASTVAISTQCQPMTTQCNVRMNEGSGGPNETYILFNCTDNFRGVLGAPETVAADTITWTSTDSTTPDFNFKLDRNFQYSYFSDSDLTTPYNSIGGVPNSGSDSSSNTSLPDSDLLSTYYLAVAGLVPVQNNADGQSLLQDTPSAFPLPGSPLIAYTLNCTITSYAITYTWSNNYLLTPSDPQNSPLLSITPLQNGTILEIAHGMQATGMPSLSQAQSLASVVSPSMTAFARAYANLHSQDTLALIASVMTPRTNLRQARRETLLVAQIPLWSFIGLIVANFAFVAFSAVLAVRALILVSAPHASDRHGGGNGRSMAAETRDMVAKLSVEGLAAAAFEDRGGKQDPGAIVRDEDEMFEESRIGGASRRIALRRAVGGTVALRIEQPHL